jgi:hypothetical protein
VSESTSMPSITVLPIVGKSQPNYVLRTTRQDKLGLPGLPWAFKAAKKPEGIPFLGDLVFFVSPRAEEMTSFEFSLQRVVTGCRELPIGEEALTEFRWQFESEVFELPDGASSQYDLVREKEESESDFFERGITEAKKVLKRALGLDDKSEKLDLVFRQVNGKSAQSYMTGGQSAIPAFFSYAPEDQKYVYIKQNRSPKDVTVSPKLRAGSKVEPMSIMDELSIESLLLLYRNVVVEGVAGTGKSHLIKTLRESGKFAETEVVVFHPSTAFEDFVEGLRPVGDAFEVQDGRFLSFCRKAALAAFESKTGSEPKYLFVIDEINRANTSKVLGDLLYSLEPSKRVDGREAHGILSIEALDGSNTDEISVLLPSWRTNNDRKRYRQRFVVPSNVYILGTMNTTDRSVGQIDLALRRRFMFTRMLPMSKDELINALAFTDAQKSDKIFFEEHIDIWVDVNAILRESVGPDAQIGHSYFFQVKDMMDSPASSEIVTSDRLSDFLWRSLLLPQIAEILVSFNAVEDIDKINGGLRTAVGYELELVGAGLDAYPMVIPKGK